jgi:hypothetical protein
MDRLLLLDTNLLLFFLAMHVDLAILREFKRLSSFRGSDLKPLQDLVEEFSALITTPHVLTEVSNFIDQAPIKWRPQLIGALRTFIMDQEEYFQASSSLARMPEFAHLALAETALVALSRRASVATLDYDLYWRIVQSGGAAIDFNLVRNSRTWDA